MIAHTYVTVVQKSSYNFLVCAQFYHYKLPTQILKSATCFLTFYIYNTQHLIILFYTTCIQYYVIVVIILERKFYLARSYKSKILIND